MEINFENIISDILKLSVNSVSELSNVVYSLINTEVAYNDFVANNLKYLRIRFLLILLGKSNIKFIMRIMLT